MARQVRPWAAKRCRVNRRRTKALGSGMPGSACAQPCAFRWCASQIRSIRPPHSPYSTAKRRLSATGIRV